MPSFLHNTQIYIYKKDSTCEHGTLEYFSEQNKFIFWDDYGKFVYII